MFPPPGFGLAALLVHVPLSRRVPRFHSSKPLRAEEMRAAA